MTTRQQDTGTRWIGRSAGDANPIAEGGRFFPWSAGASPALFGALAEKIFCSSASTI